MIGILVTTTVMVIVLGLTYHWSKFKYSYFTRRNIPFRKPKFPLGSIPEMTASENSLAKWVKEFYFEFRDKHPFAGFFMGFEPVLVVSDLNAIKSVLVSNFSSFTDHSFYINEKDDPMSAVLFSLSGERWRNIRTKLSPTFSAQNTRYIFETVYSIGGSMLDFLDLNYVQNDQPFNAKNLAMRFICDSIGSCGFGLDCGALTQSDPYLLKVADNLFPHKRFLMAYWLLTAMYGKLSRFLRLRVFPRFVTEYFREMLNETLQYREMHNVQRNDFLNLLMQIKNTGYLTEDEGGEVLGKISFDELHAQAFVIFFAGFHTSRVALSFALFELAVNGSVQQKLREEVQSKMTADGRLTYDALEDMPYLDQVVNETLRKYPPQPCLTRTATSECRIPGTNYIVPQGQHMYIPIIGIHYDPELYPDPDRFDPERMTPEKMKARHPSSFMPFGMGPRICIGQRFGLLQVKLGIAMIVAKYRLTINSKTRQPLSFVANRIVLDVNDGLWINVKPL